MQCVLFAGVDSDGEFKRRPQFGLFRKVESKELFAVINFHIRQKEPSKEVVKIKGVVDCVREAIAKHFDIGIDELRDLPFVLVGDFNEDADKEGFQYVRQLGMVELVRSNMCKRRRRSSSASQLSELETGSNSPSPSPAASSEALTQTHLPYITDCTTSGKRWIDNVWMSEELRQTSVLDAAVYRTGGLLRGMTENGYKSAGRLRSQCSDHFPIVVKFGDLPLLRTKSTGLFKPTSPIHITIRLESRHLQYLDQMATHEAQEEDTDCNPSNQFQSQGFQNASPTSILQKKADD